MKPRVFVSSTIHDLEHLRLAVKSTLEELLGYDPVMSDFNGVAYNPKRTAASSCLAEIPTCDFGVLIIGKCYGKTKPRQLSITHQEYRVLCNEGIPTFILIHRDLSLLHQVHSANCPADIKIPGMDEPTKTFRFIDEVKGRKKNSAYIEYSDYRNACDRLKTQIAYFVSELLKKNKDVANETLNSVLLQLVDLKKTIAEKSSIDTNAHYLKATAFLMKEEFQHYRKFVTHFFSTLEHGVDAILANKTFDSLIASIGYKLKVTDEISGNEIIKPTEDFSPIAFWSLPYTSMQEQAGVRMAGYGLLKSKTLRITKKAYENFSAVHKAVRANSQ